MLTIFGDIIFPGHKSGESFFTQASGFTDVVFCTILTLFTQSLLDKNHPLFKLIHRLMIIFILQKCK